MRALLFFAGAFSRYAAALMRCFLCLPRVTRRLRVIFAADDAATCRHDSLIRCHDATFTMLALLRQPDTQRHAAMKERARLPRVDAHGADARRRYADVCFR